MLLIILIIVTALVCWSLRLMQQALDRKEFSLMLAGTLVASSAAAMLVVYFLMGNCLGYLTAAAHNNRADQPLLESIDAFVWELKTKDLGDAIAFPTADAASTLPH